MNHSAPHPDPFRFGWRDVQQIGPDGSKEWVQSPLTPNDLLHPRRSDVTPQNTQHERDCRYLTHALRWRLVGTPRVLVLSDCLIDWGVRGLGHHSPDISVFANVRDPDRDRWILHVRKANACPILVIEVVSPDGHETQARDNDVVIKVREYYRSGVPLYVIVDQEREGGPRQLIGYRRGARKYVRLRPDRRGRLLLEPVRLLLGLRDERAVCWEDDTEKEIKSIVAMLQEREAVKAALAEAQARIRALEAQLRRNDNQQ